MKDLVMATGAEYCSQGECESSETCLVEESMQGVTSVDLRLTCTMISSDDSPSHRTDCLLTDRDTSFAGDEKNDMDIVLDKTLEMLDCSYSEADASGDQSVLVSRSGRCLRRCRRDSETTVPCPICKSIIRSTDMSSHVQLEIDKLTKVASKVKKALPADDNSSPRNKAYLRVKRNRLARQHARGRQSESTAVDYASCPVCNEPINGSPEELNDHVDYCLNRVQRTAEDQNVDVDNSDDEFEEYEWAGQKRVRASSMLLRDSPAANIASSSASQCDDVVDLNIEDDDRLIYGQAQYSEADLLLCSSDNPGDDKNRHLLRNALLEGEVSVVRSSNDDRSQAKSVSSSENEYSLPTTSSVEKPLTSPHSNTRLVSTIPSSSHDVHVQSMKTKILDLETRLSESCRCLICMEAYSNPLTSIQCWHVYCEECWLRTLGAKKLCPQCNVITTPSDLRRIYL